MRQPGICMPGCPFSGTRGTQSPGRAKPRDPPRPQGRRPPPAAKSSRAAGRPEGSAAGAGEGRNPEKRQEERPPANTARAWTARTAGRTRPGRRRGAHTQRRWAGGTPTSKARRPRRTPADVRGPKRQRRATPGGCRAAARNPGNPDLARVGRTGGRAKRPCRWRCPGPGWALPWNSASLRKNRLLRSFHKDAYCIIKAFPGECLPLNRTHFCAKAGFCVHFTKMRA